ncbi:MAG: alpha/beta fold hydrolase [Actinomycetota bacterium]
MNQPHLVLAHGFTQTARSWDVMCAHLAIRLDDATFSAVDLPGHGSAADERTDLWGAADHLVAHGLDGIYVGYSMGGRIALHAALIHPGRVQALVLIGATPGIDDPTARARRREGDEELARRVERDGVESFVEWWLQNPLFAGLDRSAAMVEDRCRNTPAGLASSLRTVGTGTQEPLWDRLAEIDCPMLLVVGEHDEKFRAIAERMTVEALDATLAVVPGCGHSAHLEAPDETAGIIASWLAER